VRRLARGRGNVDGRRGAGRRRPVALGFPPRPGHGGPAGVLRVEERSPAKAAKPAPPCSSCRAAPETERRVCGHRRCLME
jgi:hypothetical protein